MQDHVQGAVRAAETAQSAGENPRRDFMEKVALMAGGMLVLGSSASAQAAEGAQAGDAATSGRTFVELAGLKPEQTTGLSSVAKKVTHADLVSLAKGEKNAQTASLTFGDIRSLNDALVNSMTLIPTNGATIRRPTCCSCSCCVLE